MRSRKYYTGMILLAVLLISFACKEKNTPRPYAYFRIDLPIHQFNRYDKLGKPYVFEKSIYASILDKDLDLNHAGIDINYPQQSASIHCSYMPIKGDLLELLEESRAIVYKHTIRADGIAEQVYENPEDKVYGVMYELTGNVASPIQFVLTDSVKHFFRGALYFARTPNGDSIQPVVDYMREDIMHLVESFKWK